LKTSACDDYDEPRNEASMPILVRPAEDRDVEAMATIRAHRWGTPEFWMNRIGPYLKGDYSPQQALAARVEGHRSQEH
ncbi:MAG: hypothetical protein ACXWML_02445, partial [Candidatus Binataceae bacterium]